MSHEWTDYSQVQDLYADGHEIASHTISHSHGTNFNEEKWANEVVGEAEMLVSTIVFCASGTLWANSIRIFLFYTCTI